MKLVNKALAAGITLALASVAAHAQISTPVAIVTGSSPTSNGLYLAVWDSATKDSEVVNLGLSYSQVTLASNGLNPTAANAAFKSVANPTGATGTVLQLNFGQVAGFTSAGGSIFGGSGLANESYMVLSALTGTTGGMTVTDTATPIVTSVSLGTAQSNIQSEIASWTSAAPTTGDLTDTTGTATYSVTSGVLQSGQVLAGSNYGQSVGSAVGFYNVVNVRGSAPTIGAYTNTHGSSFWYLSSTGDLTFNVASGAAPVPLPAAIWLLGSGLLGMAGIARRRAAG
jgi:hypothetical protein